jgi:hypothetical protein
MANEFKMTPNGRVELTDAEQAKMDASRVASNAAQAVADAKEATRMGKRPKRSLINATKASVQGANTVPELRVAVANLMELLDGVLAFQNVNVDEDE